MGSISYDSKRGRLVPGLVWRFGIVADWEKALEAGMIFGEWLGTEREDSLHDCPSDKSHQTGTTTTFLDIGLRGGKGLPDFLALSNHGFPIVSSVMAKRLRASQLTGYDLSDGVAISDNTSKAKDVDFELFHVVGKGGFCTRWRIEDAPNVCPYCEKEPILCPGCGWREFFWCPRCKRRVHHGGGYEIAPDGKNLELKPEPDKWIVEAKEWDGSDLFNVPGHGGGWFANRRAKAWFDKCHILGVEFDEAFVNIESVKRVLPDGSAI